MSAPTPHRPGSLVPATSVWQRVKASPMESGGPPKSTSAPPRILVVEDEFFVAMELEAALSEAGYDVVGVADSADEALRLAKEHRPALVLMDIRLIGVRDGVDAALDIYDATGARAIFTSAHSDAGTQARAARASPHGWVAKPYRMAPLLVMVRAALNGRPPS